VAAEAEGGVSELAARFFYYTLGTIVGCAITLLVVVWHDARESAHVDVDEATCGDDLIDMTPPDRLEVRR
jgi:hypothetical protein